LESVFVIRTRSLRVRENIFAEIQAEERVERGFYLLEFTGAE